MNGMRLIQTPADTALLAELREEIHRIADSDLRPISPVSSEVFATMRLQFEQGISRLSTFDFGRRGGSALDRRGSHADFCRCRTGDALHRAAASSDSTASADRVCAGRELLRRQAAEPCIAGADAGCRLRRRWRARADHPDLVRQLSAVCAAIGQPGAAGCSVTRGSARLATRYSHRHRLSRDSPDIDAKRTGFVGASSGAFGQGIVLALEPRLKAAVLISAGLLRYETPHPMCDIMNYAPHITVPVLMINGRMDHLLPYVSRNRRCLACSAPTTRRRLISFTTAATINIAVTPWRATSPIGSTVISAACADPFKKKKKKKKKKNLKKGA